MDSLEVKNNSGQIDFNYDEPGTVQIPPRYRNMPHIEEYIERLCRASGLDGDSMALRIGSRIRVIRKALGMSQSELGQKTGLTADRVQKYENGVRKPRPDQLHDFAVGLGANSNVFVDPILINPAGVMFALFELELLYDLKISSQEDKIVLSFGNGVSERLNEYLKEWEQVYSSYINQYEQAASVAEAQVATDLYNRWKYSFLGGASDDVPMISERQLLEEQLEIIQRRLSALSEGEGEE